MLKKRELSVLVVLAMVFAMVFFACGDSGSEVEYGPSVDGVSYKIGDTGQGGGIVFYVSQQGFNVEGYGKAYYLEIAPEGWDGDGDAEAVYQWAPSGSGAYDAVAGTSLEIGTGRKNTAIILAAAGGDRSVTAPAANACAIYSTDKTNPGDWFLPSLNEIAQLRIFHIAVENGEYPGLNIIDFGLVYSASYWSSSQGVEDNSAWVQYFYEESQFGKEKGDPYYVRAIHAF